MFHLLLLYIYIILLFFIVCFFFISRKFTCILSRCFCRCYFRFWNDMKLPNHNQHLILVINNINSSNLLFSCTPFLYRSLTRLSTHFSFPLYLFLSFSLSLFFPSMSLYIRSRWLIFFRVKWKLKHRQNQPLHNIFHIHAPHLFESTVWFVKIARKWFQFHQKKKKKKKTKNLKSYEKCVQRVRFKSTRKLLNQSSIYAF